MKDKKYLSLWSTEHELIIFGKAETGSPVVVIPRTKDAVLCVIHALTSALEDEDEWSIQGSMDKFSEDMRESDGESQL